MAIRTLPILVTSLEQEAPIRFSFVVYAIALVATLACQDVSGPRSDGPQRLPLAGERPGPLEAAGRPITPANHLGTSKIEIAPQVIFPGFNVMPFGINDVFGFTGFIYRDVPAFSLAVGDVIAFDTRQANDVQNRRTIFFAAANKNPAACVYNVTTGQLENPQGVAVASGWTQVVSEAQVPQNPFGDAVLGNFELRYTAEAPFTFAGGGLLVGFQGRPPATFVDSNSAGSITGAQCTEPSGHFYARFFLQPDQTTAALDVPNVNKGDGTFIGGMIVFPAGAGGGTSCGDGIAAARADVASSLANRPVLRAILLFYLSRIQGGSTSAVALFDGWVDFGVRVGIVSSSTGAGLKAHLDPCR